MKRLWIVALLSSAMVWANLGCDGEEPGLDAGLDDVEEGEDVDEFVVPEGTAMRFDVAGFEAGAYFDLPFPDDLRRGEDFDGVFLSWPGAARNSLLGRWFAAADELLEGWGLSSAVFGYFQGPLDATTIPRTPEESVDFSGEGPSVFLVDVDPGSSHQGEVLPIRCDFREQAGTFHDANQLGCISPFGVLRRPSTRYALVLTDGVKDREGESIVADETMARLLAGIDVNTPRGVIQAEPYQEALEVVSSLGVETDRVASVVLFTTMDPSARLRRINNWYRELPTPELSEDGLEVVESFDDFVLLQGTYDVPVIQEGERPYPQPPQGRILFDEAGQPDMVDTQRIRFYLTIPRMEASAEGFPVLFYLHGSGGVAEELIERGPRPDPSTSPPPGTGPGGVVAPYGIAGFAADFNLHGMRHTPRDTTGLQLYNLLNNPRAAVDNFIIAANEVTLHARLVEALEIQVSDVEGLAGLLPEGVETIRFNQDGFAAMGQSMGSTIGLPALTVDDRIRAGIFSGSGGVLIEVALRSMRPINVGAALRIALGYQSEEELNRFDPILSAVQHVWDFVDPVSHASFVFLEPHEGIPPKHSLQHSGLDDGYFSPESRAAFSTALGAPLVEPLLEEEALDQMGWRGLDQVLDLPVEGNVNGVTAVVTQYEPSVLDGHNVAFQRADAQAQYACFIRSLVGEDAPTLRSFEDSLPENCP